ncbi:hypothetical protein E2C01_053275 [Portunus trituberculatus]|uniref:Uncharacterized protein n=1 Tax=Portunus trituberculatus TaxID=210409 RepID=A0A5B7GNT0_PORTR|nr:hypothetical protein [Portunus trituberculatus]
MYAPNQGSVVGSMISVGGNVSAGQEFQTELQTLFKNWDDKTFLAYGRHININRISQKTDKCLKTSLLKEVML